jgi:hypothetical protein
MAKISQHQISTTERFWGEGPQSTIHISTKNATLLEMTPLRERACVPSFLPFHFQPTFSLNSHWPDDNSNSSSKQAVATGIRRYNPCFCKLAPRYVITASETEQTRKKKLTEQQFLNNAYYYFSSESKKWDIHARKHPSWLPEPKGSVGRTRT